MIIRDQEGHYMFHHREVVLKPKILYRQADVISLMKLNVKNLVSPIKKF